MEWNELPWDVDPTLGPPAWQPPPSSTGARAVPPSLPPSGRAGPDGALPTRMDLEVIALAYQVMAGRSRCVVCDEPLGAPARMTVDSVSRRTWTATVSARCRGWVRHWNRAVVLPEGEGLRFGAFSRP
jgi:hypothetical protein